MPFTEEEMTPHPKSELSKMLDEAMDAAVDTHRNALRSALVAYTSARPDATTLELITFIYKLLNK